MFDRVAVVTTVAAIFVAVGVIVVVAAGVVVAHNCLESNEEALIDPICGSFN